MLETSESPKDSIKTDSIRKKLYEKVLDMNIQFVNISFNIPVDSDFIDKYKLIYIYQLNYNYYKFLFQEHFHLLFVILYLKFLKFLYYQFLKHN